MSFYSILLREATQKPIFSVTTRILRYTKTCFLRCYGFLDDAHGAADAGGGGHAQRAEIRVEGAHALETQITR